jgi:hypothetical protein
MDEVEITKALQTDLNFHKIKAQVKQREDLLHILVTRNEGNDIDYSVLFEVIQRSLESLNLRGIDSFVIYGRVVGNKQPEWQKSGTIKQSESLGVEDTEPSPTPSSPNGFNGSEESMIIVEDLDPLEIEIPDYHQIETGLMPTNDRESLPPPLPIPVRRQKQKSSWIPIASILAVLAVAGIGYFLWDRSNQEQSLTEAKAIASKTFNPDQIGKIDALRVSQQELQKAVTLLSEIPDRPGSFYPEAQTELTQINPKLDAISKKLAGEEIAAADLENAKTLAQKATQLGQQPPTLDSLKAAQTNWQEAIKSLEKIPKTSLAAKERDAKLTMYKANFAIATAKLQKQRQIAVFPDFWSRRVSAATKKELSQLKAAKVSKIQFIRTCSSLVRPGLTNSPEVQKTRLRVTAFAAGLCNYGWTAK